MDMTDSMRRIINRLLEAAQAYYQEDREIMSNYEYDSLYDELVAMERKTGIVMANSPTVQVGHEVVGSLVKVPHDIPMLSLDKTKEVEKLSSFLHNQTGVLSWKLDGLTIALTYDGGKMTQAVTRGNGQIGEDVTHTARVFKNIPLTIPFLGRLTLRGEAIIRYSDFARINEAIENDGEKYKNPRNLCSGTVRQLNSEIADKRNVRFYAFGLVSISNGQKSDFNDSKLQQLRWLSEQGFETVGHFLVQADTVTKTVERMQQQVADNDIASDGLVLTYDSISYGLSLGATSKFPRDTIAFKWADELSETVLLDIEWNTSRTGLINPIAVFEPVEIEGTTVSKASLHNVSVIKGLELGINDLVTVYKANMIIPQIAENLTRSNTASIPAHCPVCGGGTEMERQNEAETLYCVNPTCRAQLLNSLAHFCSRNAMNIEGLSAQTLEKFIEGGFIEDYSDIFLLNDHRQAIIGMEGLGKKSFLNLVDAIEKAKDVELPNFINALGIKNIGLNNAKLLAAHFNQNLDKIIEATLSDNYEEELNQIRGFGEVIIRSLRAYFTDEKHMEILRKALLHIRLAKPEGPTGEDVKSIFKDMVFVITGDTQHFENRSALQAFIESHGGRCTGSVTSKTTYLVNNDISSASSKNKKAQELNIPIINEEKLLVMVGS